MPSSITPTNPCADYPKLIALDVAQAFLADGPRDPKEVQMVQETALLIGQHLADLGHAGDWSKFQARRFFQQIGFMSEDEQIPMCLTIVALYGWLGAIGLLPAQICKEVLGGVVEAGPQVGFLRVFAERGLTLLDNADLGLADTLHLH